MTHAAHPSYDASAAGRTAPSTSGTAAPRCRLPHGAGGAQAGRVAACSAAGRAFGAGGRTRTTRGLRTASLNTTFREEAA
ncbi:hypothetical protein ACIRSU_07275 [Streptomyces sp. NPDC101160]|uniref:hypothetical protein n=1 Tax=Streptomyces sp. NPDC101160 TaxID=3366118 RepID=UPI00381C61B6